MRKSSSLLMSYFFRAPLCLQKCDKLGSKRFMSLGNPMFVSGQHRPRVEHQHEEDGHNDKSRAVDILANHGGKIALIGFSFAAALVYRWFIGGRNRTDLEETISLESPLHPYESNDLRIKNSMTCDQFSRFASRCRDKFQDGFATFDEFVQFFQEEKVYTVVDGYILDRIILSHIDSTGCGFAARTARLPTGFFLVALSNVVHAPVDDRIALLFNLSKNLTAEEPKGSVLPSKTAREHDGEGGVMEAESLYCPLEKVETLVSFLVGANQIPYEKMVQESGVYYPFKLFRRKTAHELVAQSTTALSPPPHKVGLLSVDEFTELLAGSSLCVWGECYRKNV